MAASRSRKRWAGMAGRGWDRRTADRLHYAQYGRPTGQADDPPRVGPGDARWKAIADQTKGVCFIATPHSGADLANYIKFLASFLATVAVSDLKANDSRLIELNQWYRNHAFTRFKTEVYCEKKVTGWKGLGVIVVDAQSADPGIPGVVPIPLDEDHLSICKPGSPDSLLYKRIRRFVRECLIIARSGVDRSQAPSVTSTNTDPILQTPARLFGVPNIPDMPFLGARPTSKS